MENGTILGNLKNKSWANITGAQNQEKTRISE
jgi:hypothetical protein